MSGRGPMRDALKAARLRQRDVATALGISEPTVSKVLAGAYGFAREEGRVLANRVRAYVAARITSTDARVVGLLAPIPAPVPPCGSPAHRSQRTCAACHAAYQRAHRPRHAALSEPARRRANARSHANTAQQRGHLTPAPCEVCGTVPAEKHHDDYTKPLEVRWLCPVHHRAHHEMQRSRKNVSRGTQTKERARPRSGGSD